MTACRFIASDQPRAVVGEHYDECETADCAGCWPCRETHCLSCGQRHAEVTCTHCLAKAREDLTKIAHMCGFPLLEEALLQGVDSEAAMLLGPAADAEAWNFRKMSAIMGRVDDAYLDDCRDEAHPLWTLGWIEAEWREAWGHSMPERQTVHAAADYISQMLHVVAEATRTPDGDQAPEFSNAKQKLAECRSHLENVLNEGERAEKGAPCIACRARGDEAPPLVRDRDNDDITGASDKWRCPKCRSWWGEADYRLRVGQDHIAHAPELTASDMTTRTRVPAGTLRRWASKTTKRVDGETVEIPPKLKPCGKSPDGRRLYRVSDVIALRDGERGEVA